MRHEANTGEAKDHHGPGGGFGNGAVDRNWRAVIVEIEPKLLPFYNALESC